MLNSPFMQAGATKIATKSLLKGNKFNFNNIIGNLEKTVSTINQVVPLYNQVKPLITNSKTIINAFKKPKNLKTNKKHARTVQYSKPNFDSNIINVEVTQSNFSSPIKETKKQEDYLFTSIDIPNKPFFN